MENIEDWRKAGRIAAEALAYGKSLIVKGASYLDVTEKIEAKIKELGGECAFPAQMSLNDVAAHFTVDPEEDIEFTDQIVSLDVGVHVNGAIGDTACTVDLSGKHADLVKASEEALEAAIKIIKPGIALGEIGKAIHAVIIKYGFSPITNLSGHGLGLYDVHTAPTIPNFDTGDKTKLEKGMVIAIEPFATAGAGIIYESSNANIFMLVDVKPVRNPITRKVLQEIANYNNLPFCTRWLAKKFSLPQIKFALRELRNLNILKEFPPLPDKAHGLVSQAEHTILVDEKVEVLTSINK